jgi:hypothetical protein
MKSRELGGNRRFAVDMARDSRFYPLKLRHSRRGTACSGERIEFERKSSHEQADEFAIEQPGEPVSTGSVAALTTIIRILTPRHGPFRRAPA